MTKKIRGIAIILLLNQNIIIFFHFQAFRSGLEMWSNKDQFEIFRIPIAIIPCTISNNMPGISFTIGNDTAVNIIVNVIISMLCKVINEF